MAYFKEEKKSGIVVSEGEGKKQARPRTCAPSTELNVIPRVMGSHGNFKPRSDMF